MIISKKIGNARLRFAKDGISITGMAAVIEQAQIPSLKIMCKLDSKTEVKLSLVSAIVPIKTDESYIGIVQGEIGRTPLIEADPQNIKGRESSNLSFICPVSCDMWLNISPSIRVHNGLIVAHTIWGDIEINIPSYVMGIDPKVLENLRASLKAGKDPTRQHEC